MKKETLVLKSALIIIAIPILALCIFVVVPFTDGMVRFVPELKPYQLIIIGIIFMSALSFLDALVQAFKLLILIDHQQAFSLKSSKLIQHIRNNALAIAALYVFLLPVFYLVADKDDAPGVMAIGLAMVYLALVVAAFAEILKKLVISAFTIKSEMDLTV